ncbi:MAG TPA: tRNA-dihydrouridine synthase [Solirubrobacteraceae bacterium]|nr:tRNA-dihydrouridine synthase [Solirubrobacteraceae bacterium]
MPIPPQLTESWFLGPIEVPNRVLLAPLAGIGNWFVRLQAKRYGAGMAVSEMVSSHAIHHRNERTLRELLRIDAREREAGPISIQLFGEEPAVMRSAAAHVARVGADAIDINMGCPVPKVAKTGAGAGMLADPDRAVAVARAAREGALDAGVTRAVAVTVKLRSGLRAGERSGFDLAHRLVVEAGVDAIAFHPRSAAVQHRGRPDYDLAAELVRTLPAPVILTGGLSDAASVRAAFDRTGAAAVMLARGALGNPWLFAELLAGREGPPTRAEVLGELDWTIDRAVEHLGAERATRYLRKFYPWYLARLGLAPAERRALQERLQRSDALEGVRGALAHLQEHAAVAA